MMCRYGLSLTLMALAASVFIPPPAVAEVSEEPPITPERRLEIGNQAMAEGERHWRGGNRAKAQESFETALGIWEGLEADYPGWQPHLIRRRILQADSAIRKILDGRSFLESSSESQPNTIPSLDVLTSITDERTAAAITALRAGIEERDAAIRSLQGENRQQKEELARLRERVQQWENRTGKAEDFPTIARAVRSEARRLLESGEIREAIALLEEGVRWFSEEPAMQHLLAIAYCREGRYGEALRLLTPMTRWGRGTAEVWLTVGVAYLGLENLGRARWAFEKALARDSRSLDAHYNLASILIRLPKPDPEEAAAHYSEAREQGLPPDEVLEEEIRRALLWKRTKSLK